MDGAEFVVALLIAVSAGGYIGCVVDRRRRRPRGDNEHYPRRWVESIRMDRLHVIEDELLNGRKDEP